MMKRCLYPFLTALLMLGAACQQVKEETPETGTCLRTLSVRTGPATRSILPETAAFETTVNEVTFAVYGIGSGLLCGSAYAKSDTVTIRLLSGKDYRVYALANMGDLRNRLPARESGLQSVRYDIGDFASLATKGMPMAGDGHLEKGQKGLSVPLRKLLAKVTFRVDHSALTDGVEQAGIRHTRVLVRQAARALYPLMTPGSMALSAANDIQDQEADNAYFPAEKAFDLLSEDVVFYVPENAQGALLQNNRDPMEKVPARLGMDVARRCTYLEFQAVKDGALDGVSGDISFRFYLGADTTTDFSVLGNTTYDVSLFLSWDKLFLEGSWKVTRGDDWADGRVLALTDSTATAPAQICLPSGSDAQRMDIQFHRGEGGRVLGARDIASYPYGWTLYVDGESTTEDAGILDDGTAWSYTCTGTEEYLTLTPPNKVREALTHRIQLKTTDGQVCSEDLLVEVLPQLTFSLDEAPVYVGQRGRIRVADGPEGGTYSWTAESYTGESSLEGNADGSAVLEFRGLGSIHVKVRCHQTGQIASQSFYPSKIHMHFKGEKCYAWPDGSPLKTSGEVTMLPWYSADKDGDWKLTVQNSYRELAIGDSLALDLYENYLYPVFTLKNYEMLNVVDRAVCAVRLTVGNQHYVVDRCVMLSQVLYTGATSGIVSVTPLTAYTYICFNHFTREQELDAVDDYGLTVPYLTPETEEDRTVTMPVLKTLNKGVWAKIKDKNAEQGFQEAFTLDDRTVSYNFTTVPSLTRHKGGSVTLHADVQNIHSGEHIYSPSFARFDCFVHAAGLARLVPASAREADVVADIAGDYGPTPFANLDENPLFDSSLRNGDRFTVGATTYTVSGYEGPVCPGGTLYHLSASRNADWKALQDTKLPGLLPADPEVTDQYTFDTYYILHVLDRWMQD